MNAPDTALGPRQCALWTCSISGPPISRGSICEGLSSPIALCASAHAHGGAPIRLPCAVAYQSTQDKPPNSRPSRIASYWIERD